MLSVIGNELARDENDGCSLLDEIVLGRGARRILVAALETEVAAYLEAHRAERDDEDMPWSSVTARAAPGRSRSGPGRRSR